MEIMTQDLARNRIQELEAICNSRPTLHTLAELGSCYFTLNESERSLPLVQRAWERHKEGLALNLGMIYKDIGDHEKSLALVEEAYWADQDNFYTRLAYAEALLRAGFWKQAWPIYDNARPTQQGAATYLQIPLNVPEWNGGPLPEGSRLLVINEGGAGDRLSYARWLPELTKRGINWNFFPFDELFSFFERIFPREVLVKLGDNINPTHWTTTFSLPAKLNAGPNEIPPPLPITAMPENIEKYTLNKTDNLPIFGICYEAAELNQGGRRVRSLTEGQAARIVCQTADKIHWVSLQYSKKMAYPVTNLTLENWEDTAGVLHNLDAVITVDTGLMHLAGAMGKPMGVLLSSNSCWKFGTKKKKLPLYPSATFYRNEGHGSGFEHAVNTLIADIRSGAFPSK